MGFKNSVGCSVFSNYVVSLDFCSSVNRNWALRIVCFEIRVCLDLETAHNSFTTRRESSLPNIYMQSGEGKKDYILNKVCITTTSICFTEIKYNYFKTVQWHLSIWHKESMYLWERIQVNYAFFVLKDK